MMTAIRAFALVFAPLAVPCIADVLLVDPAGPPGAFPTIEHAVQAATDGDTIVVKSGTYLTFYVDDKGVAIVAAPGAFVQLTAGARVVNLSPGKRVLLAGFEFHGTTVASPYFAGRGLTLLGNEGSVRVQDCHFFGANNLTNPPNCTSLLDGSGWPGVLIQDCTDVTFVECGVQGGRGLWFPQVFGCPKESGGGKGGHGMVIESSRVALFHTFTQGGEGGQGGWGGHGGNGLVATGTNLFSFGGAYVGGSGGFGFDWVWGPGGNGGTGAHLIAPTTGIAFEAYGGDKGGSGLFFGGSPGADVVGAVVSYPGPARDLHLAGAAVGGNALTFTFRGLAGELPLLLVGVGETHIAPHPLPLFLGVASPTVIPFAPIAANGKLVAQVPTPPVPPAKGAWVLPLQAAFVTTTAEIAAGPPRHVVLLSQAP